MVLKPSAFVNRHREVAEFVTRLHAGPVADVLVLCGEGGIGKTLLLDEFENTYCRRLQPKVGGVFDPWLTLAKASPEAVVGAYKRYPLRALPCARINFWRPFGNEPSKWIENTRDVFEGLQSIRRKSNIPAPLFNPPASCIFTRSVDLPRSG